MENVRSVAANAGRQRRRQPRVHDHEGHPAVKKGNAVAKRLSQIRIRAASARKPSCKFAVAQGAAHRHGAHDEPCNQDPHGRSQRFRHACGGQENADRNALSYDNGDRRRQSKFAAQSSFGRRHGECFRHRFGVSEHRPPSLHGIAKVALESFLQYCQLRSWSRSYGLPLPSRTFERRIRLMKVVSKLVCLAVVLSMVLARSSITF